MLLLGESISIDSSAFLGVEGIGDMIATSTSHHSRNYRFGYALGENQNPEEVMATTQDLVEGISTTKIMHHYAKNMKLNCPDRKSTRLNSSHVAISYAVFCLKKKKKLII